MSNMRRYRVAVQPYKSAAERANNGVLYSTADYYETIVEAIDSYRAMQIAAAPHGGTSNAEIRVLNEVR